VSYNGQQGCRRQDTSTRGACIVSSAPLVADTRLYIVTAHVVLNMEQARCDSGGDVCPQTVWERGGSEGHIMKDVHRSHITGTPGARYVTPIHRGARSWEEEYYISGPGGNEGAVGTYQSRLHTRARGARACACACMWAQVWAAACRHMEVRNEHCVLVSSCGTRRSARESATWSGRVRRVQGRMRTIGTKQALKVLVSCLPCPQGRWAGDCLSATRSRMRGWRCDASRGGGTRENKGLFELPVAQVARAAAVRSAPQPFTILHFSCRA
jgi:hypothetical protein